MHADYAVLTGARHTASAQACQDFCLAGADGARAWGVVADGCSDGALSDLGARAWGLAARSVLQAQETATLDAQRLAAALHAAAQPALQGLAFEDGFATLGLLQVEGDLVRASFFGDGALLARHRDGAMTLVHLQYSANAPAYLNYGRRADVQAQWALRFARQDFLVATHRYDAGGACQGTVTERLPAGGPWQWSADARRDGLELVLLASDGVASRPEGFVATARKLLAVRNPAGEFLRRRVGRLAREWSIARELPADDLAVAGAWLGRGAADG